MSLESLMEALALPIFFVIPLAPFAPLLGLCGFLAFVYLRPQDHVPFLLEMPLAKILGAVTIVGMLLYRSRKRGGARPLVQGGQDWVLLGLLGAALVSMLSSIAPNESADALSDFAKIVLVYFLVVQLVDSLERFKRFYGFIVGLHCVVALIYAYMYKTGYGIWGRVWGLQKGFLGNPDEAGVAFVVGAAFLLSLFFWKGRGLVWKGLMGGLCLLMFVAVLLTGSRGSLLSLFAVIALVVLLNWRRGQITSATWTILGGIALFAAYRFRWTVMDMWAAISPTSATALTRFDTWQVGLEMFRQNPIFGVGIGSYTAYWQHNYLPGAREGRIQVAHNVLLEVGAQTGIVGLLFYFGFVGYILRSCWRLRKAVAMAGLQDPFVPLAAESILVAVIGFLLNGMFITVGFYWHLYLLGAMAAALSALVPKALAQQDGSPPIPAAAPAPLPVR